MDFDEKITEDGCDIILKHIKIDGESFISIEYLDENDEKCLGIIIDKELWDTDKELQLQIIKSSISFYD